MTVVLVLFEGAPKKQEGFEVPELQKYAAPAPPALDDDNRKSWS